jgi:hypothetical protein
MGDGLTKEEKTAILKQAMKDGKRFEYLCEMGVDYDLAEAICWKTPDCVVEEAKRLSLDEIEIALEAIAAVDYDGHYTAMRFTTGYKAFFGTPDLGAGYDSEEIFALPSFSKLKDAMIWAIEREVAP